jgi:hypothetical protein
VTEKSHVQLLQSASSEIPNYNMTFWSKIKSAIKYCIYFSIFCTIAAVLSFSLYIGPTLYKEYKLDSPWDPASPTVQATFDRILRRDQFNVYRLTTYNYKSLLRLSDDLDWMRKDLRHSWIYVTGNKTCESSENCERFNAAFDDVVPAYYLNPPANNASMYTLDCDTSPFLCNALAVYPPALIRLESLGFPHCKIFSDPLPRLRCPYGARYIPLPTNKGLARMLGSYRPVDGVPDEKWQLRSLFESTCAHEVYIIQRLLGWVGNGGEPMDASEDFGFFVTMLPVAEVYGKLFSWWLGEGHRAGAEGL